MAFSPLSPALSMKPSMIGLALGFEFLAARESPCGLFCPALHLISLSAHRAPLSLSSNVRSQRFRFLPARRDQRRGAESINRRAGGEPERGRLRLVLGQWERRTDADVVHESTARDPCWSRVRWRWHCQGPDKSVASFLAAVRANARPLGRQGLGQRCRRHDPTGPRLCRQYTAPSGREVSAPRLRLMRIALHRQRTTGLDASRDLGPATRVVRRHAANQRSEVSRPDRDVPERCLPPKEPRPPCAPIGEQDTSER
jgi:hypothetical protein